MHVATIAIFQIQVFQHVFLMHCDDFHFHYYFQVQTKNDALIINKQLHDHIFEAVNYFHLFWQVVVAHLHATHPLPLCVVLHPKMPHLIRCEDVLNQNLYQTILKIDEPMHMRHVLLLILLKVH